MTPAARLMTKMPTSVPSVTPDLAPSGGRQCLDHAAEPGACVLGDLGHHPEYSSARAREELGWTPRPLEDSIAETGESLIEHGIVKGTISWISEGAFMVDERTSQPTTEPYYKARVALTDTNLRSVPDGFRLMPGMTLTADVHIGTRSILTYLVSGAVRRFSEAMREP